METQGLAFGAVIFAFIVAWLWHDKGGRYIEGFVAGLLLGPLAIVLVLIVRPNGKLPIERQKTD